MMKIIPAVDILNKQCVQLVQGVKGTEKIYGNPVDVALDWIKAGADTLHIIDLDGALGGSDNLDTVVSIVERVKGDRNEGRGGEGWDREGEGRDRDGKGKGTGWNSEDDDKNGKKNSIDIQFGGGIRDFEKACKVLDIGVDRVILGTVAVKSPEIVENLVEKYGKERIIIAVDSKNRKVVIKGWTEDSGIKTVELIGRYKDKVFGFLVTDVDNEGKMQGIDINEFKELTKTGARIIASGGISDIKDLKQLEQIGVWGVVLGKALYEGKIPKNVLTRQN